MPTWEGEPERDYPPASPGTQVTWTAARWPTCWVCRLLGRWPLWNARDRHMDKRHPYALEYLEGP